MKTLLIFLAFLSSIFASLIGLKPPSKDSFYSPPVGFATAKPGDILKIRNTPSAPSSLYLPIVVKNAWQLLIRSEDSFGNPNAFVATLIQPLNANPSKLVSYQSWEDASHIDCSPSYGMQFKSPATTVTTQIDMTLIVPLLQNGYYVIIPDYEGPKSTFTVGRQSGKATLNSIRAALQTGAFSGIKKTAKVALWGYSGGSLATGWAISLQLKYAPELKENLIGAAVGGFATNITAVAEAVDGTVFSGFIPLALNGLANEYPDFKKRLYGEVKLSARSTMEKGSQNCLAASLVGYPMSQYFTGQNRAFEKGWGLLQDEVFNKTIEDNLLLKLDKTYLPQVPVLIYHGTIDEIIPIKDANAQYQIWCDRGIQSLEFAEDLLAGHLTETFTGAPAALSWIDARFSGKPVVNGCQRTIRSSNVLYPGISITIRIYFEGISKTIFGVNLGSGVNADKSISNKFFAYIRKYI